MPAEQISVGIGLAARRTQVHTLTVPPSGRTEPRRPKSEERSRPMPLASRCLMGDVTPGVRNGVYSGVRDTDPTFLPSGSPYEGAVIVRVILGPQPRFVHDPRHQRAPAASKKRRWSSMRRRQRSILDADRLDLTRRSTAIGDDRGRRPSATPGGPKATRSGNPLNRKTATPADPHHPGRTRFVRLVADPAFPGSRGGVFDALALGTQAIPHRPPPSSRRPGENKRKTWGFSARAGQDEDPQGSGHRQGCHDDAEPGRLGDRRGRSRCRRRPQPQDPGQ